MRRCEVTDKQWKLIELLIPAAAATGRKRVPPRTVLNGVLWVVRSGSPWRDLPERYGPWQSIYHHFNSWRRTKVFERMLESLQMRLDAEGHVDWDLWCVDGSTVRASRAAAGAGKKGAPANPQTTHWVARAADSAANSTWLPTVTDSPSRSTSRPGSSTRARSSKKS